MAEYRDMVDDVWDRIDEEIRRQNLNKKELAKRCEFDRKNLFGHRNMRILYFARLCKELNISADYLLFGNDWEEFDNGKRQIDTM